MRKKAFVAYSSHDKAASNAILDGVRRANAIDAQPIQYEPWEFNDIPGTPLTSPILTKIDQSPFVVADITYLNLNVVYEVGYSVGRFKRVFLIRNKLIDGDKSLAQEVGIFDTLGYYQYESSEALSQRLVSHIGEGGLPFDLSLDRKAPVYIVDPISSTNASIMVTSRIKKSGYRFRSFMPQEESRLSANDAVRQIAASAGIVLLLQKEDIAGADIHNIRSLFAAGVAHGMGKPTLIIAPKGYSAPIDIRDSVKYYTFPNEIVDHIAAFCPDINDHLQQSDVSPIEPKGALQTILLGDPTAENEMTTLSSYFLRTDQYERALRGEVNLIVGRKGSGKTALFIMLRDRIRLDKRNIVVDLKPEGYQLIKLKEDILSYLTDGARQHLITAFWEYLILLEVSYKILEKDKITHKFNHDTYDLYQELDAAYRVENFASEGDFSERLLTLSARIGERYADKFGVEVEKKLTSDDITGLLYAHDIRLLRDRISKYLEKKQSVWILFDNLDKGWSTQGIEVVDTIVLRCLIDAGRKVEREMRRDGHTFHCIVFVRNDVYEHLMARSADYGKEMRATLDWTDPDVLREMLRLRFVSGLEKSSSEVTFAQIWNTICSSHVRGEESSAYIIERSLLRPRNVLKIISHSRGFANNLGRVKITEGDIEKGMRAYSQDLIIELDRELMDVYPDAKDLLYHFIDSPSFLNASELLLIIKNAGIDDSAINDVIDFLLYYGVLGINNGSDSFFIFDVGYDIKALTVRASRATNEKKYVINPAFGPALGLKEFQEDVELNLNLLN